MFSRQSPKGLSEKADVQHRVICDWLRNIDKKLTRTQHQIEGLTRNIDSILENEDHADSMARELDDK